MQGGEQMSNRVKIESQSFRGSTVYLTRSEKEALIRAIDQYQSAVTYASDRKFIDFFQKYDEQALISAENKLETRR